MGIIYGRDNRHMSPPLLCLSKIVPKISDCNDSADNILARRPTTAKSLPPQQEKDDHKRKLETSTMKALLKHKHK